jgi:glycosyltransferase involved in cell wall biosynthesis
VIRIIARLNVGGPAIQVISLTRLLRARGYETVLLRGREGDTEGSMDHLAAQMGVAPVRLPGLRRGLGLHDLRALFEVVRWQSRFRPAIVHTHTAKAGALGRIAAQLLPRSRRPAVVVHTFHGHVLKGEFSPRTSRIIAAVERMLAKRTTRLIAVSSEIKQDLVHFRVAPADKIEVIRLGFDLDPFLVDGEERSALRSATRARMGLPQDGRVVTVIARVVKVKRLDRFLTVATKLADLTDVHFLVAGDGDLKATLSSSPAAEALGKRLHWVGFERDVPAVCAASDVVVLTSDNEGTPVCLIEAQAAALPVVSTDVGGVRAIVQDGTTGRIVDSDPDALAHAVRAYLEAPALAAEHGARGREYVLRNFRIDRLVHDIDRLYNRLLAEHAH